MQQKKAYRTNDKPFSNNTKNIASLFGYPISCRPPASIIDI